MKYYIIAGEASGDLHASNLMKELKGIDVNATFRCWGGDLMKKEGGVIVKHYSELAFMGFIEVLLNIRTILNNLKCCKKDIQEYQPDAVILIDYPGFNLRIARFVNRIDIPVLYYISPQVWAWKKSRVNKIKEYVTKLYVILPFEKDFYKQFDIEVTFVGHPLIDAIEKFKKDSSLNKDIFINKYTLKNKKIISLLPGSRKQEVSVKLPIMINAANNLSDYQFVIAGAPSIEPEFYKKYISINNDVNIIYNDTYNLLNHSYASLVTSGTATLETALFNVPQVVCYKASRISYMIAKRLIKVKYISLVNLILNKPAVKELIQNDLTESNLCIELNRILDPEYRKSIINDYDLLNKFCGGTGASNVTANEMFKTLESIKGRA